jgi:hypothetical protein
MFERRRFAALSAVVVLHAAAALPAFAQNLLYTNGPDGNVGYYRVNLGAVTTNSFTLNKAATITGVSLTLYTVDDRNTPQRLKWTITTEPLGGMVLDEGWVYLTLDGDPYLTRFQFFAFPMSFGVDPLRLPAGTYYLQIENVMTRWLTYGFWAQSSDGNSQAYYAPIGPSGAGGISLVPSESFSILGEWDSPRSSAR